MRIAIITLESIFSNKTGDIIQARKTVDSLNKCGIITDHLLLRIPNTIFILGTEKVLTWDDINENYDILHSIPPIPTSYLTVFHTKLKLKLAASTIFWRSLKSTKVISIAKGNVNIKSLLHDLLAILHIRSILAYELYDLLLPNSQAEIGIVRNYCRLKKKARIYAIPNAIDPVPDWALSIPKFEFLPKEEYILYPGTFAFRKNQLEFIRAMRNIQIPIIFIGDGHQNGDYLRRCNEEASDSMKFLGHIEHGSKEFYSCLRYARVACLASDCETPGIALLEAAALGARPVVTQEGGTVEYYGWDAIYLNPLSNESIRTSVLEGWKLGRLSETDQKKYRELTWHKTAELTIKAYRKLLED